MGPANVMVIMLPLFVAIAFIAANGIRRKREAQEEQERVQKNKEHD